MGYKRVILPRQFPSGAELTAAMVGIGMNFAAVAVQDPNIEDTILAASLAGMEGDDLRTLSVLTTWLGVHHDWINADRLLRGIQTIESERVRAFWASVGRWLHRDRRLARFSMVYKGPGVPLLRAENPFYIERRGEDVRFRSGPLCVPDGTLRDRVADVLTPVELAKRHAMYRQRILMGPSYRADMWTMLNKQASLSPSELARRTYGSFATAWRVKHDRAILTG